LRPPMIRRNFCNLNAVPCPPELDWQNRAIMT